MVYVVTVTNIFNLCESGKSQNCEIIWEGVVKVMWC